MRTRQSAADWAAEADRHASFVEERRVLPSAVTAGLIEVLRGDNDVDKRESVLSRVEAYRERSLRRVQKLLSVLDCAAALEVKAIGDVLSNSLASKYASSAGLNRFLWIIAVAGSGTDRSAENVQAFVDACGSWMATSRIVGRLSGLDPDLEHGVRSNPRNERDRRTAPSVVHFRWVSELFCTSMAVEIENNGNKYAGMQFVTQRAVRDLFKWVELYVKKLDRIFSGEEFGPMPLPSACAGPLVEALTLQAGSYQHQPIESLMASLDIETYPFVRINGVARPVAFREATYGVELALLNLARRLLPNDKDRSDLFEDAVKRSLAKVLPPGIDVPQGSVYIPISGTVNKGETDFIFRDLVAGTFVGECKAMSAAKVPGTVINNFTDQVGKATGQLRLRMDVVASGGAVTIDGKRWVVSARDVYGIAVTLHSYGGAVWNHECLPYADGHQPDLAVIPIHQLLVVARAMGSASDFASYIGFRSALFDMKIELFDELDILAAYMFSNAQKIRAIIDGAPEHGGRVIRAYGVDLNVSVTDFMPTSSQGWRNRLKRTLT